MKDALNYRKCVYRRVINRNSKYFYIFMLRPVCLVYSLLSRL